MEGSTNPTHTSGHHCASLRNVSRTQARGHLQFLAVATIVAAIGAGLVAAERIQQTPVFRARTEIVQIDVTVLDRDRRPISGLAPTDFVLIDEGKPQEITAFAEIHIPDASDGPAWMRHAVPDVRTADDGRVLVFLIDDAQVLSDRHATESVAAVKRIWTQ